MDVSSPQPPDAPTAGDRVEAWASRRPAPPLSEFPKYPVTSALAVTSIATTAAFWAGWDADPLFLDLRAWEGQVWRLVTATFLHGDVLHLVFNLYWLWIFGTTVEGVFRPVPCVGIVLLFAVGSSAAQYAADAPGIGLSGVGYGLFGLLLVLARWDPRFARTMDRRTVFLFLAWFVLCWVMTRKGHWRIGNTAHAYGTVLGILLGLAIVAHGTRRVGAVVVLAVVLLLALVGGATAKPSAEELALVGYHDLESGRDEEAVSRYQRAVEMDATQADWWLNLGIAQQRIGRAEEAMEAYRRGLAIRPQNRELKEALVGAMGEAAVHRHTRGDLKGAVTLYQEMLAIDKKSALAWYNLGAAYQALDNFDSARNAFGEAVKLEPTDERFRSALQGLMAKDAK